MRSLFVVILMVNEFRCEVIARSFLMVNKFRCEVIARCFLMVNEFRCEVIVFFNGRSLFFNGQ